jgi:hypothetical protein
MYAPTKLEVIKLEKRKQDRNEDHLEARHLRSLVVIPQCQLDFAGYLADHPFEFVSLIHLRI